jgi:hypothetical protein
MRYFLLIPFLLLSTVVFSQVNRIVDPAERYLFEVRNDSSYFHVTDKCGNFLSGKAIAIFKVSGEGKIIGHKLSHLDLRSPTDTISCAYNCDSLYGSIYKPIFDHCTKSLTVTRNNGFNQETEYPQEYHVAFIFR